VRTNPGEEELHKAHVANHSGYDLINPNEFFDKFGSYLLTMMYMIRELSTSSLFYEGMPNHLGYVKKNLGRLIDETIRWLEATPGDAASASQMKESEYQLPTSSELDQVKQYLKVEDGECVSGGLIQTIMHDGLCKWTCKEHQYDYHVERLRERPSHRTVDGIR
jgi:hypothetical protein